MDETSAGLQQLLWVKMDCRVCTQFFSGMVRPSVRAAAVRSAINLSDSSSNTFPRMIFCTPFFALDSSGNM